MLISYQVSLWLSLSFSLPLALSFACISFKWLRIFLISAFFFFFWGRGNHHVKHKFFIVLSLVLTWVPGTRRYCAVLLGIFYTSLPVGHGMTNCFYGSTRVVSSRLGSFRAVARRLSSLGSVCFCLSSLFFLFSLSLGEFSFTSPFISLHFVNQFAWEAFVYGQHS